MIEASSALGAIGLESDWYKLVLALHLLTAILGFGATAFSGVYYTFARKRGGTEGVAIMRANAMVGGIAGGFLYATFGFGLLLVVMSDDVWRFGATWIWLSITLWAIIVITGVTMIRPTADRALTLMEEIAVADRPDPEKNAALDRYSRALALHGTSHGIMLLAIIALMVWRPGQ